MRAAAALWLVALLALPAAAESGRVLHRKVAAADGTALALYHYPPAEGGSGPAVLLVPELGFGRESFDLEGQGLARYLQGRGRDVFVAELRGQGQAASPAGWRLSQLMSDLNRVLDAIAAARPGRVDLVVHGYGGGLLLAACAGEAQGKVRRVVALAPAVWPEVPNAATEALLKSGGGLHRLAERTGGADDFDLLFARNGKFSSAGRLTALRKSVRDLDPAAAQELLAWMQAGDLPLPDGTTLRGRFARYERPTLVLLALRDNFAHPEFGAPLRERVPAAAAAKIEVELLTRLNLLSEDYTHLSLLHGASAPSEIFSRVQDFLAAPEPLPPGVQRAEDTVR